MKARATVRSLKTLGFLWWDSAVLYQCSHENTWAASSLHTGGFPTCRTLSADCDAADVNNQEVSSGHPLAWVRKQAKFEGLETIAWTAVHQLRWNSV